MLKDLNCSTKQDHFQIINLDSLLFESDSLNYEPNVTTCIFNAVHRFIKGSNRFT